MALTLYNTRTRKKELFKPIKKGFVGFYACGPTVYNYTHVGNLRTYIFEDVLKRTLKLQGYRVKHIMNITDVEDKIIRDAARAEMNIREFTKSYEAAFYEDLRLLAILPASTYPKATEHIQEMVALIQTLLKKGLAYESEGSVYFNISRFGAYGTLSGLQQRTLKAGARVDTDEYAKDNVQDFVLWKGKKEGEPFWPAPFGEGRPGWHIECSAMSMKYLGSTFDIHAGGVDLIFPHHENEIAQSEGATGKQFARFFMEGEHLLVKGEKMSKSLGNAYTLRDITAKGYSPLDFRYLCLTAHYRTKLNFTWESLSAARAAREELTEFVRELQNAKRPKTKSSASYKKYKNEFFVAMNNDLNIPKALAVGWKFVKQYRKSKIQNPRTTLQLLLWFDNIFGLNLVEIKPHKIPIEICRLADKREQLRNEKRWEEADTVRKELASQGWSVEDTSAGPKVRQK